MTSKMHDFDVSSQPLSFPPRPHLHPRTCGGSRNLPGAEQLTCSLFQHQEGDVFEAWEQVNENPEGVSEAEVLGKAAAYE